MKFFKFLLFCSFLGVFQNSYSLTLCSNNPSKAMVISKLQNIFDKHLADTSKKYSEYLKSEIDFSPSAIDESVKKICSIFSNGPISPSTAFCNSTSMPVTYKVDKVNNVLTLDNPWLSNTVPMGTNGEWYMGDWMVTNVRTVINFDMIKKQLISANIRDLTIKSLRANNSPNLSDYPYEIQGDHFLDRKNNIFWVLANDKNKYIQYKSAVEACKALHLEIPTKSQLSTLSDHDLFCQWPNENELDVYTNGGIWLNNGWYVGAPDIFYPNHIGYKPRPITRSAVCVGKL